MIRTAEPASLPQNYLPVFSALTTCNWVLLTHSNTSFSAEESILQQIILPASISTRSTVQIFNNESIFTRKGLKARFTESRFVFSIFKEFVHPNSSILSAGLIRLKLHYQVNYFTDVFFMFVANAEEDMTDEVDIPWLRLPPKFCLLPSDMTIFHVSGALNLHSAFKRLPVCESGQSCLIPLTITEKGQGSRAPQQRQRLNLYGLNVETLKSIAGCEDCLSRLDSMDLTALVNSEAAKLPNFKLFRILQGVIPGKLGIVSPSCLNFFEIFSNFGCTYSSEFQ